MIIFLLLLPCRTQLDDDTSFGQNRLLYYNRASQFLLSAYPIQKHDTRLTRQDATWPSTP